MLPSCKLLRTDTDADHKGRQLSAPSCIGFSSVSSQPVCAMLSYTAPTEDANTRVCRSFCLRDAREQLIDIIRMSCVLEDVQVSASNQSCAHIDVSKSWAPSQGCEYGVLPRLASHPLSR